MPDDLAPAETPVKLTAFTTGGGCGCKIAPDVLTRLLGGTAAAAGAHPDLLVDAAGRDDAAVYRISDETALVATTDFFTPIVDDPFDFGRIAATNALSDVYAMGARPILALALVGMPVDRLGPETVARILAGGRAACETAGAPIAGGHSIDIGEPVYGLAALGLVRPDRLLTNAAARTGDVLILGKPLGVGVLSAAVKQGRAGAEEEAAMIASMTRLNTPGPELAALAGVHAATDVTGFGLLGHLSEMCAGAGLAAHVDAAAVPVLPGVARLLAGGVRTGASARNWRAVEAVVRPGAGWSDARRDLFTDPQTSGGLLIACAPDAADAARAVFAAHGHEAAVIGRFDAGPAEILIG